MLRADWRHVVLPIQKHGKGLSVRQCSGECLSDPSENAIRRQLLPEACEGEVCSIRRRTSTTLPANRTNPRQEASINRSTESGPESVRGSYPPFPQALKEFIDWWDQ